MLTQASLSAPSQPATTVVAQADTDSQTPAPSVQPENPTATAGSPATAVVSTAPSNPTPPSVQSNAAAAVAVRSGTGSAEQVGDAAIASTTEPQQEGSADASVREQPADAARGSRHSQHQQGPVPGEGTAALSDAAVKRSVPDRQDSEVRELAASGSFSA